MAEGMKPFHWILAGAFIPIALIVAWGMLDTACSPEAAGAAKESVRQCYRSWIGALSGWAAALAAAVTMYFLHSTVNLAREANEQSRTANELLQKQTKAAIGDLEPTLNYNGNDKRPGREVFRFWNKNRRAITIDSISVQFDQERLQVAVIEHTYDQQPLAGPERYHPSNNVVRKTIAVQGTAIGDTCKPHKFVLSIHDGRRVRPKRPYTAWVMVTWRFRDENREEKQVIVTEAQITPKNIT
ncbi:MAG: hypothetical protein AAFX90_21510 [Pseudomonadota bacterium]